MRTSAVLGFLLVLAGLVYFLGELNIVQISSAWLTAGVLWPLVLVVMGVGGLRHFRKGRIPWCSLFFITLGLMLSLRNSGVVPALHHVGAWGLTWALVFVFIGAHLLTPRRYRKASVKVDVHGKGFEVDIEDLADSFRKSGRPDTQTSRRWIGDISIGRTSWTLRDLDLWNYVGDIRVNLTTAHVEDGVYHVRVGGWIGDVRVLVPQHLPVTVNARVGLGDVTVFDDNASGTGRVVHHVDPDFADADKKVVIDIDLKIGDVQVVRF